jgi:two-component system response regulator YesN
MIVEDEGYIRSSLAERFDWRGLDCEVIAAVANGDDALAKLASREPVDLMLTDICMDGMDGLQLAERARRLRPHLRIVFLTGHAEFEYARSALRLAACDFLLKPADPRELARAVRRALAGHAREYSAVEAVSGADSSQGGPVTGGPVDRIRDYLEQHYPERISLRTLTGVAFKSRKHICRLLKRETGQTFLEILQEIRLAKARDLLASSSLGVAEVAYRVGFEDPHYFSRIFRRRCGTTPSGYRAGCVRVRP